MSQFKTFLMGKGYRSLCIEPLAASAKPAIKLKFELVAANWVMIFLLHWVATSPFRWQRLRCSTTVHFKLGKLEAERREPSGTSFTRGLSRNAFM